MKYAVFFLLVVCNVFSQRPQWEQYANTRQSNCILEDGDYLWIGTDAGLAHFERETGNLEVLNNSNSGLPFNYVTDLAFDGNHRLWIAMGEGYNDFENGIAAYDDSNWEVFNHENSPIPEGSVNSICIESDTIIWIGVNQYESGAGGGLARYDGHSWTVYTTENSDLLSHLISVVTIDTENRVWIGSSRGVSIFDGENWTIFANGENDTPYGGVRDIDFDSLGNAWAVGRKISKYDGTTWTTLNPEEFGLYSFNSSAITVDENDTKWIGFYEGGLMEYNEDSWAIYDTSNTDLSECTFESNIIITLESVIIGTDQGIKTFNDGQFTQLNTTLYNFPSNYVMSLAFDNNDKLYMSTFWGLVTMENDTWEVFTTENSDLPFRYSEHMCFDESGRGWFSGNFAELMLYSDSTWTVFNPSNSPLPQGEISGLLPQDNGVWISTYNHGILFFDGVDWTAFNTDNSGIPTNHIRTIRIDTSGTMWLATYNHGLCRYSDSTWVQYDPSNSDIPRSDVYDIEVSDDVIWVTTNDWISQFDGETWLNYELESENIDIEIDENGLAWIRSWGNGLLTFDGMTFESVNSQNSGFPATSANCIMIDDYNNKWFGSRMGLTIFNETGITSSIDIQDLTAPDRKSLISNFPNPFNNSTRIQFFLTQPMSLNLSIYTINGKLVSQEQLPQLPAGEHQIPWESADLPSGVYLYKIWGGEFVGTGRGLLLK